MVQHVTLFLVTQGIWVLTEIFNWSGLKTNNNHIDLSTTSDFVNSYFCTIQFLFWFLERCILITEQSKLSDRLMEHFHYLTLTKNCYVWSNSLQKAARQKIEITLCISLATKKNINQFPVIYVIQFLKEITHNASAVCYNIKALEWRQIIWPISINQIAELN